MNSLQSIYSYTHSSLFGLRSLVFNIATKRRHTLYEKHFIPSFVARSILSIPATSTSSERSFSMAGRTLEDRRSQPLSSNVDKLLFLRNLGKLL